MTADALRDRIAQAIECSDDEPYDEPEDVYLLNADAVLAVLADADPTDIGLEQVGWQLPEGGFHDDEWVPHFEHDLCMPVYARPRIAAQTVDVGHVAPGCPHPDHRTEETPDA